VAVVGQRADRALLDARAVHPRELGSHQPRGRLRAQHAPRGHRRDADAGQHRSGHFANTSAIGVTVTCEAGMLSFSAPITRSSSSSGLSFAPSYLIGENPSATSACFSPCASFAMITIERFSAFR